jgi:hypothetical protein
MILQPLLVLALSTGIFALGNSPASQQKTEQTKKRVKGKKGGYEDLKASVDGSGIKPKQAGTTSQVTGKASSVDGGGVSATPKSKAKLDGKGGDVQARKTTSAKPPEKR